MLFCSRCKTPIQLHIFPISPGTVVTLTTLAHNLLFWLLLLPFPNHWRSSITIIFVHTSYTNRNGYSEHTATNNKSGNLLSLRKGWFITIRTVSGPSWCWLFQWKMTSKQVLRKHSQLSIIFRSFKFVKPKAFLLLLTFLQETLFHFFLEELFTLGVLLCT